MGPPWGAFCQITLTSCFRKLRFCVHISGDRQKTDRRTDRQTNRQKDGHHHRINPPLSWTGLNDEHGEVMMTMMMMMIWWCDSHKVVRIRPKNSVQLNLIHRLHDRPPADLKVTLKVTHLMIIIKITINTFCRTPMQLFYLEQAQLEQAQRDVHPVQN